MTDAIRERMERERQEMTHEERQTIALERIVQKLDLLFPKLGDPVHVLMRLDNIEKQLTAIANRGGGKGVYG